MLSKKDKEWIRLAMRVELKSALVRKIEIKRGPRKQGDPEEATREEEWNVLDFLAVYLPLIEGGFRGMQETLDHAKNHVAGNNERLEAIGKALLGMESPLKAICAFADQVRALAVGDGEGVGYKRVERMGVGSGAGWPDESNS